MTRWKRRRQDSEQQMLPGFGESSVLDPPRPPAQRVATSIAAAERIAPAVPRLRALVLDHIRGTGAVGATRQEIADALNMRLQSVCGRCNELLGGKDREQYPVLIYQTSEARDGGKVLRARKI